MSEEEKFKEQFLKSKNGIKTTAKTPFEKVLSASKDKILNKLLDQFRDEFNNVIADGIKKIIQQSGELLKTLSTVSVSKATIIKIVKDFVQISTNIEDFTDAIKNIIGSLTDLTSLNSLTSAMETIVTMQQLNDFVENIKEPFKEISSNCEDKDKKLNLGSVVDEISHALADFITNLVQNFIKETISEKNEKKKSEGEGGNKKEAPKKHEDKTASEEKYGKIEKNGAKINDIAPKQKIEEKTSKSKKGTKSGFKNAFKRLLSASKEKIINKLFDLFKDQLNSIIKNGIKTIIQKCPDLMETLNAASVSKSTMLSIVNDFVQTGTNIDGLTDAIKDLIENLTDLTSLTALTSTIETLVDMHQLVDLVQDIGKAFKEISSDCEDKEKLSSDSIVDEISQVLANFITNLFIKLIKESIFGKGNTKTFGDDKEKVKSSSNKGAKNEKNEAKKNENLFRKKIEKETPESKQETKTGVKGAFKGLWSVSKNKILDQILDQFRGQFSTVVKDGVSEVIQRSTELLETLNTVSVSKDTITKIVKDFVQISANIEDFTDAIKNIITSLTDLTSLDDLTSVVEGIVKMQQLKDLVENIHKPLKEISTNDDDDEKKLTLESIVVEISQALADFVTDLVIEFIKETINKKDEKKKLEREDGASTTDKTIKEKKAEMNGAKEGVKINAFKKLLNSSKDKILDKLLDQFKDQLSSSMKDGIKKIIQECAELLKTLNTVSVNKDTLIKIVKDFVQISDNIDDFIDAVKDIVASLADLTSLDVLTSAMEGIVKMQQLKDLVENIHKPLKEILSESEAKEDKLSLDSIVDEVSQILSDSITDFIIDLVKKIMIEKEEQRDVKGEVENKKQENNTAKEKEKDEKNSKAKNVTKSGVKNPFKKLMNSSKDKILNKFVDQFKEKLDAAFVDDIKKTVQQCGELLDMLKTMSISKTTIIKSLVHFAAVPANIEEFEDAINITIANLTDLTNLNELIYSIDIILKLKLFDDFIKNYLKLLKESAAKSEDEEEKYSSDALIDEICKALSSYITLLTIDFIRNKLDK